MKQQIILAAKGQVPAISSVENLPLSSPKENKKKSKCTKVYVLHDNLWVVVKGKRGYCIKSVAK